MVKQVFPVLLFLWVTACQAQNPPGLLPSPTASPPGAAVTASQIPLSTPSRTPIVTLAPLPTSTPTATLTATTLPSATITPTATPDVPEVTALMQAFCRYGPGKAYLYSHGLYSGDHALVHGRNASGSWLWVKPDNLNRECWVSASVVEVHGDLKKVHVVQTRLPHTTLYGPPEDVQAERDGDQVTVTWNRVWMTEDDRRGYLIEATVCVDGHLSWMAVQTDDTSFTFTDAQNCTGVSGGQLYAVDKHGYTDPVDIPWP